MTRPQYEALDAQGLPYLRQAMVVGELPTPEDRRAALLEATPTIAVRVGITQLDTVKFGIPVFYAFEGMTRPKAKHHHENKLLLTLGHDVSLDFCKSYN